MPEGDADEAHIADKQGTDVTFDVVEVEDLAERLGACVPPRASVINEVRLHPHFCTHCRGY